MGPIEVLYCWQSLLCALSAAGLTQLVKTIIDIWWGHASPVPTPTVKDKQMVGKFLRQRQVIVNRLVLPMLPIIFGALYAITVPARPDAIATFVASHALGTSALLVFAAWGGACGQFADYIVGKARDLLGVVINRSTTQIAAIATATATRTTTTTDAVVVTTPGDDEGGS